ncbi:DUF6531 domain-containing protein [Xanthomonas citri]|uniref:DUF6531 domain-containing protein n=1 Tax=Xanthomonas citri TaxID=346 RepID=UPI003CFEF1F8|nr:hypothetical protein FICKIIDM_01626 [Xanthomonas citri pv. punicae]UIS28228.1 hypothetical protein KOJCDNHJ_01623 [Xanthomonas citri pv. punicae]
MVGNPINMFTGNKYERAYDYHDTSGHLDFSRSYNSTEIRSNPTTMMGPNWRHSYQRNLLIDSIDDGIVIGASRPSGNQYIFRKAGTKWSPLKNYSQAPNAMFASHGGLEDVEERARTTCNQARKNAIQRSSHRRL